MKLPVASTALALVLAISAAAAAADRAPVRPEENPFAPYTYQPPPPRPEENPFSPYDYQPPPPGPGIARGPALAPTYDPGPLCAGCGYTPVQPRPYAGQRPLQALPMPEGSAPTRSPSSAPPSGLLESHDARVWGGH